MVAATCVAVVIFSSQYTCPTWWCLLDTESTRLGRVFGNVAMTGWRNQGGFDSGDGAREPHVRKGAEAQVVGSNSYYIVHQGFGCDHWKSHGPRCLVLSGGFGKERLTQVLTIVTICSVLYIHVLIG